MLLHERDKDIERPVVLVIDDQPAIRDMLFWTLHFQGYHPVCLANGVEALEWIENALNTHQYPAAILLDLIMPLMNGRTFLTRLRDRWNTPDPLPPIILLSVDKNTRDDSGVYQVLLKPFHINELCACLKRVMAGPDPNVREH